MKERKENEASVSSYHLIRRLRHILIAVSIITIWLSRSCCPLWEDRPVPRPCLQCIELLGRNPRMGGGVLLIMVETGVNLDLATADGSMLICRMV